MAILPRVKMLLRCWLGLGAYVFVKLFVGVLGEAKQSGLVLGRDRQTFFQDFCLLPNVCRGSCVCVSLVITAW